MYWNKRDYLIHTIKKNVINYVNKGYMSPITPYYSLFLPFNNELKYKIATNAVKNKFMNIKPKKYEGKYTSNSKQINIGYISRRFEYYPGTQLMIQLFTNHNRTDFKIYSYAHGPDDKSIERKVFFILFYF